MLAPAILRGGQPGWHNPRNLGTLFPGNERMSQEILERYKGREKRKKRKNEKRKEEKRKKKKQKFLKKN